MSELSEADVRRILERKPPIVRPLTKHAAYMLRQRHGPHIDAYIAKLEQRLKLAYQIKVEQEVQLDLPI